MAETPQFNREKLPEIEALRARIEKLEAELRKETPPPTEEKEKIVRQEIKDYLEDLQRVPSFAPPMRTRDEVGEIEKLEVDQRVGALIELVFDKGLEEALKVANALDNPAILDEFHDVLVDRYYQTLVEQKIITPA